MDSHFNSLSIVVLTFTTAIAYLASLVTYRLYFHPIARFPGPKLAAATKWYEFYFDVIKKPGGQFSKHVAQLHRQYGSIVRINPDELHIQDSDFYDAVYSSKRNKWPPAAKMAGMELSPFATVDHDVHRQRRAATAPMISRRAVLEAIPMIRQQLVKLQEAFQNAAGSESPLELGVTFLAFTTDVAGQYFFMQAFGMQDDARKAANWKHATHSVARGTPVIKQFPGILKPALSIPLSVWKILDPVTSALVQIQYDMSARAKKFMVDSELTPDPKMDRDGRPPTLFHAIYNNPGPDAGMLHQRLTHEGLSVVIAGSETTAKVLSRAIYYLCVDRQAMARLRKDIQNVASQAEKDPQDLSIIELEKVLWLACIHIITRRHEMLTPAQTAVIKETVRVTALVTSRLPLQPHTPIQYREWTIPAMAPVSMSPRDVLLDPVIYPDPELFKPSRWLTTAQDGTERLNSDLDHFFVAFGRGTRMCLGLK
jgi:cytochrome P450